MTAQISLEQIRHQWERGLTPKLVIKGRFSCLVVLVDKNSLYHLHRYYMLGGLWTCSVDASKVPLTMALYWLNDPRAISQDEIRDAFTDALPSGVFQYSSFWRDFRDADAMVLRAQNKAT